MKQSDKTYKFIRGIVKAGRRKIEPRDWYYENRKGHEIDYGNFWRYVKKSGKREMNYVYKLTSYNKKAEKKQLRRDGYIADYYDNLF